MWSYKKQESKLEQHNVYKLERQVHNYLNCIYIITWLHVYNYLTTCIYLLDYMYIITWLHVYNYLTICVYNYFYIFTWKQTYSATISVEIKCEIKDFKYWWCSFTPAITAHKDKDYLGVSWLWVVLTSHKWSRSSRRPVN